MSAAIAPEWRDVADTLAGWPGEPLPAELVERMQERGYRRRSAGGTPYQAEALVKRFLYETHREAHGAACECEESNSAAALGALLRRGVARVESAAPSADFTVREFVRFREADRPGDGASADDGVPVVVITEGRGNLRTRNFYSAELLDRIAPKLEGVPVFIDHPTLSEDDERPERSIRDKCGWLANAQRESIGGLAAITATLKYGKTTAGREAREAVETERQYRRDFPENDRVFVGLSINAGGPSHKIALEGEQWNHVDDLDFDSVDLVTVPARGGRVLGFREADAAYASHRWRRRVRELLGGSEAA